MAMLNNQRVDVSSETPNSCLIVINPTGVVMVKAHPKWIYGRGTLFSDVSF